MIGIFSLLYLLKSLLPLRTHLGLAFQTFCQNNRIIFFFQKFFKFLQIFSISVVKIVDEYEDMKIVIRFNFYQAPLLTNFWNPVTYVNEQPKKIRQNGNSLLACLLAVFELSTGALILKTTQKNVLWWILLLFLKRALLHKIKFPFINLFMLAKQIINVKLYFYIVQKFPPPLPWSNYIQ